MTLTAIQESTKEIASPKSFNSDVNPKDFTREQAQALTPINTEVNLIDDSKMQKQFNYDNHHWGANKKVIKKYIQTREKHGDPLIN